MIGKALLWASTNPLLAERLPQYAFVRRATRRFLAGETLDEALNEAARLADSSITGTATLLGEDVETEEEADAVLEHYLGALRAISERGLDVEISVKPTQLGLDFSVDRTQERIVRLLEASTAPVWIDMERSGRVDATLDIFKSVLPKHRDVGLCLQSYLHRTRGDLEALLPLDPSIRLVKGAYDEPASVAYPQKTDVDQNFVRLTGMLLRARASGGKGRPVIGTHDPRIVGEATRLAYELNLKKGSYEFAMLYGIDRAQQGRLARGGHAMRVLLSYGSGWFPWYMRRLAERPANVFFVLKQLIR
ncbi:MAG: proline dehydrogenase family protein [Gemmatimonadetes bacterium]|nr:proline dehydrogenase family protein [Gemmatimonadota bacterium]